MGPEQETQDKKILIQIWIEWNQLLEDRGLEDEDFDTLDYDFAIDRRQDAESSFSADDINVYSLKDKPLEDWIPKTAPNTFKTEEGEEWITIKIYPKDPYHPRLGHWYWQDMDNNYYYTEKLDIFISNHGRAFEFTGWSSIFKPDLHEKQNPAISYLKEYPKPEEIETTFTEEPEEITTEPFQPLKGESFERLLFLTTKLQRGEIIAESTSETE